MGRRSDDPEALQQRGWDDVNPVGKMLFATEISGQLFDGRQDKGTVAFLEAAQQARDHLALVVGAIA